MSLHAIVRVKKSYPDHPGRPGKVGGSLPKNSVQHNPTLRDAQKLDDMLRTAGGIAIYQAEHDPYVKSIINGGKFYNTKGKKFVDLGDETCHWNVAKLFAEGKIDAIAVGYTKNYYDTYTRYLIQHTWGMKDGKIVETTVSNENNLTYFGITLSKEESKIFSEWALMKGHEPGHNKVRYKSFPGHQGIPGHQGGSLPANVIQSKFDVGTYWRDQKKVVLYHGTSADKIDKIKTDGLVVGSSGNIFLTSSPKQAGSYSVMGGEEDYLSNPKGYIDVPVSNRVILELEIDPSKLKLTGSPNFQTKEAYESVKDQVISMFGNDPSDLMLEFTTGEKIPPSAIKRIYKLEENTEYKSVFKELMDYLAIRQKEQHNSAIVAFDCSDCKEIIDIQRTTPGEPSLPIHLTILFLGDLDKMTYPERDYIQLLEEFAKSYAPIEGKFNGIATFDNDLSDSRPVVALFDSPALPGFYSELRSRIKEPELEHGFTPHVTLTYADPEELSSDDIIKDLDIPHTFKSIWLYWGDKHTEFPLTGNIVIKALIIDDESKANLINMRIDLFNGVVDDLAEQVFTGEISIGSWEEAMKKSIRELYTSTAAIAKGGWNNMTFADWGRLGNPLKAQYQFLHGFAQAISDRKDTISLEAIKARAHMYGESAGGAASLMEAGHVIENLLPWLPRDGSTKCLTNCCCRWELEVVDMVGDFQLVQATWRVGEAEHCQTCVGRDGYVIMIKVYKTITVPKIIGDFCR